MKERPLSGRITAFGISTCHQPQSQFREKGLARLYVERKVPSGRMCLPRNGKSVCSPTRGFAVFAHIFANP